jgi:hypothetical protein
MLDTLLRAEELGVRLEIVGGLPIWEAHPVWNHQKQIDRIRASLPVRPIRRRGRKSECACVHASDVYIRFPDGSLKRSDIAIFCREPDESEQDDLITLVPEAVVEVISKGYEAKDLEIGPHFYLSQGVKDVIVFDPYTLLVLHARKDGAQRLVSPVKIKLECGCEVEV